MCGLAGFVACEPSFDAAVLKKTAQRMGDALRHRGPDDGGVWVDAKAGVALSHRRLSILDLSTAGHQPMASRCGRYVLVYNGEVYNYRTLRDDLQALGQVFDGHSDTEVLLAAMATWGVRETLTRANGMFAFALWDMTTHSLTLGRDRLGQKPLYYGFTETGLAFASELKAIEAAPGFRGDVNRDVVALFMRFGYVPDPYCVWSGMAKLTPGTIVRLGKEDLQSRNPPQPQPYWQLSDVIAEKSTHQVRDEKAAVDGLEAVLSKAVGQCMVSDVPLGAFLSGGIDSSLVTALMQAQSKTPVRSFSIGFDVPGYNEADHAKAVARHLGTDHTELYVSEKAARDVIPGLADIYDEPFSDPSMIPTLLVSRLAKEKVTVALSGDGGDELFGGYNRYLWASRLGRLFSLAPRPLRKLAALAAQGVPPAGWDGLAAIAPGLRRHGQVGDKVHKLASVLDSASVEDAYGRLVSLWRQPNELVVGAHEPQTILTSGGIGPMASDMEAMMATDTLTYLPGDILTKVDRASMAVSLETRVPLLDHDVVAYAWGLPLELKVRKGWGKWALRHVLYRHVPRELIDRPKMGFGVPIDTWLRGDLRDWAEDLLSETRLRHDGYLNPGPVRAMWREHLSGRRNWPYHLWAVLMFQMWLDRRSA